jgi:hypothetical protein
MDFDKRLAKAIERGHRTGDARSRADAEKAITEQELQRLHTQYRLQLDEHIGDCLKKLGRHFPGFRFETLVCDRGWGAAVSRDDLQVSRQRRRANYFSRLEMLIRPVSEYFVLELTAKATIRNKELFNRTHFQRLAEVDVTSFTEMIDHWVLEFAELYAARQ